ncbi:MAG: IS630 family transposase [Coriobacteriales bacterium]|jgi:transposase|nr:IS630 family transposase [Coriobacteriales bacterium]
MPRTARRVECDEATLRELKRLANSQTEAARLVRRARMVLGCVQGRRIKDIAQETGEQQDVIIKWRDRFIGAGLAGLLDKRRPGKPVVYGDEWKASVLAKLDEEPPYGMARWDGPTLADELKTSEDAVQRFLQKEGIQLARMRAWCVSTDPEFAAKAADVVGLYLAPPQNAVVISIDEKPSMQALSRTTGYVASRNGKFVRAVKSTYKRNGTQNLTGALVVATGQIIGKATKTKKRADFLSFMDDLLSQMPKAPDVEYHVILDNYCIHKCCDEWLLAHPDVHFHYTPTSASWLNQIEIWFNILGRKVLRGPSFNSTVELVTAIEAFIEHYNETAEPFEWKKREVKGSQIRDTLSNSRG